MSLSDTATEYVVAAGRASPPLAVSSAAAAGWSLNDWVMIVTLLYTLLQIALLIRKYVKERRAEKAAANGRN